MQKTVLPWVMFAVVLMTASLCPGQSAPQIGIEERLGEVIALDTLSFVDEDGRPISLRSLFDRPVILTLVYYRCPGICTPLLQELAKVADLCDLVPGEDYRIVTISFDADESPELAKNKQTNMLATMGRKKMPREGWRFLTGDAGNIRALTEAAGFRYIRDENKIDFVHAATLIFLSSEGKIVRYLNGTRFNPADLKLAVLDASEGRARSFMQRIQQLCYTYDSKGRTYVLQINRLILGVTIVFALTFGAFLILKDMKRKRADRLVAGGLS